MTIYFTSDLHFGHKRICELTNRWRFTTQEEHTEWLINLHNSRVQSGDTVFILGDLSFCKEKETVKILEQLNGDITVVRGNHDSRTQLRKFVYNGLICNWHEYLEFEATTKICMMHYPIAVWNKQHHGAIMLHGHSHGSFQGEGKILDVGLDSAYNLFGEHKYFSLKDICNFMDGRSVVVKDHHVIRKGD